MFMKKTDLIFAAILVFILASGCTSQQAAQNVSNSSGLTSQLNNSSQTCMDQNCFIAAANSCQVMNVTITDNVGTFALSSIGQTNSTSCIFSKTVVSLNSNETQNMQNLLDGKSMTCIYQKGNFDSQFVTALIGGIEYCSGPLKDDLGNLIIFT